MKKTALFISMILLSVAGTAQNKKDTVIYRCGDTLRLAFPCKMPVDSVGKKCIWHRGARATQGHFRIQNEVVPFGRPLGTPWATPWARPWGKSNQ